MRRDRAGAQRRVQCDAIKHWRHQDRAQQISTIALHRELIGHPAIERMRNPAPQDAAAVALRDKLVGMRHARSGRSRYGRQRAQCRVLVPQASVLGAQVIKARSLAIERSIVLAQLDGKRACIGFVEVLNRGEVRAIVGVR